MHARRLLVAIILLPLLFFFVMKLPAGYFLLLLLLVSSLAQAEFYAMFRVAGILKVLGILSGIFVLSAVSFAESLFPHAFLLSFIVITVVRLFVRGDPSSALQDVSPVLFGIVYIPCLLAYQFFLRVEQGPAWVLFLYGMVWISDSFAYYVGKGIGRRKLYPSMSPNKTVEGAVASCIGGVLSGWLLNQVLVGTLVFSQALIIGGIVGTVTIVGDLIESMFKRDAGVKDSGVIIPGHGGILDKIDGALLAGPVLYWIMHFVGYIQ